MSDKLISNPIPLDGPAVNYNSKSVSQSSSNKPVTHKGKRVRNNKLFLSADCHSDYWIRRKSIFGMKSPHEKLTVHFKMTNANAQYQYPIEQQQFHR